MTDGVALSSIPLYSSFTCLSHGTKQRVVPETLQALSTLEDLAPRETRRGENSKDPKNVPRENRPHQVLHYRGPFLLSRSDIAYYSPEISGRTIEFFAMNTEPRRRINLRFTVATLIPKGSVEDSVISPMIAPTNNSLLWSPGPVPSLSTPDLELVWKPSRAASTVLPIP